MIALQDEPIADPVCVPVYYVSRLARDHDVVVAQVGEGADELFCGYPYWKMMRRLELANRFPVPKFIKRLGLWFLRAIGHGQRSYTELLRRGIADQPVFWGGAEAFTEAEKQALLSPRLKKRSWDHDPLAWMTYLDLNLRLPELLLMRVDKMSMGVSLEARVPFLDHEFVTHVMSLSSKEKLEGGGLKPLLKRAVRGLIPDSIIDRPKQGFAIPMNDWNHGPLGKEMEQVLRRFCAETDFFDSDYIEQLLREGRGPQCWYLTNFALWWNHYIDA
jgi:asparagine synthase (glutamine-hydrolysing)